MGTKQSLPLSGSIRNRSVDAWKSAKTNQNAYLKPTKLQLEYAKTHLNPVPKCTNSNRRIQYAKTPLIAALWTSPLPVELRPYLTQDTAERVVTVLTHELQILLQTVEDGRYLRRQIRQLLHREPG